MSKQRSDRPLKMDKSRTRSCSNDSTCNVCHENIEFFAIGHCDHPICYKCSTRMRVLCDQMYCAICRADIPKVAFIRRLDKFDRLKLESFCFCREKFIFFEDEAIRSAYYDLLEIRCKLCQDGRGFPNFKKLEVHMNREHNLYCCDLCMENLKLFSCDRKFYDRKQLAEHKRHGDSNDTSYRLHPICKFCDKRYFDNDELLRHLRKDHYFCHFCETDGINNEYFEEYSYLRDHFREKHFLCEEDECARTEFLNAFRSDIDLKAHVSTSHGKHLGRHQARQLRTIEVDFNYGPRPQDSGRRNNIRHRGGASGAGFEDRNGGRNRHGRSDQRHREEQERRTEVDTALAISLSLSEAQRQGSVSVVSKQLAENTHLVQSSQSSAAEKTKFSAASDDFPSLDQRQSSAKLPVQNDDKNGSKEAKQPAKQPSTSGSLAQVLAFHAGRSVKSGGLDEADFPSLGSQKPSGSSKNKSGVWQQNGSQASGSMSNLAEKVKGKPSAGVSKSKEFESVQGATASRKTAMSFNKSVTTPNFSDFPVLGASSCEAQSSGTWVRKKENVEPEQPPVQTERSGLLKLEIKNKGKQRRDNQLTVNVKQSKLEKPDASDKNGEGDKLQDQANGGTAAPVKSLADVALRLAGNCNLENEFSKKGGDPLAVENATELSNTDRKKQKKSKAEKDPVFTLKEGKVHAKDTGKASSIQITDASANDKGARNVANTDVKSRDGDNVEVQCAIEKHHKDKKEKSQSANIDGSDKTGTKKKGKSKSEAIRKDLEQANMDVKASIFESSDFPKLKPKQKAVNIEQEKVDSKDVVQLRFDAPEFKIPSSFDTKGDNGFSIKEKSTHNEKFKMPLSSDTKDKKNFSVKTESTHGGRDLATGAEAVAKREEELVADVEITTDDSSVKNTADSHVLADSHLLADSHQLASSESSGLIPVESSQENCDFQPKFAPSDFPNLTGGPARAFLATENIGTNSLFMSNNVPHLPTYPVTSQEYLTSSALLINSDSSVPSLHLSTAPPPPGFSSAAIKPPPGFSSNVAPSKPPPGFKKPLISEPDGAPNGLADGAIQDLHGVPSKTSSYIPPKRSQDRNTKLIENIMNETTGATFDRFKEISMNFRKNHINAKEYYTQCSEVIGMEAFQKIFPELVVLLPNIETQQELLAAHRAHISRSSSKKTNPWSTLDNEVMCCSFCGQVVLNDDSMDHWMEHSSMDSKPII